MMWQAISPSGLLTARTEQSAQGDLSLALDFDKRPAIGRITLGAAHGLRFISLSERSIHESYSLPAGKEAVYENRGVEQTLAFAGDAFDMTLCVRVYDNGLAFRCEFSKGDVCPAERTVCMLNEDFDQVFAQELFPTYERPYYSREWEDMTGRAFGMPLLSHSKTRGLWLLMSEAEVLTKGGQFSSCHFVCEGAGKLAYQPAEDDDRPLLPVKTPWRIFTLTDSLDALTRSHLCYDVVAPGAPPAPWMRPARALWAWWEYENGAQLYSESKKYVDYAVYAGFEAVTLDCGWDGNWVKTLCDYAHARGVQIWLWTARQRVDTYENAARLIPTWANWGVDGLKIDFFENDSRETMGIYGMLAEMCLEYRLMVNFHGSTKPMGEGRAWPHFMTAEGIMGLEHYKWSDLPNAAHNCTVPFTRNVSGPMDYTPTGFSNRNRNTTRAHQLALPVVFDSGVTHYALSIFYMEPWLGARFLRRTKAHYDEARLLSGFPGKYSVMMRRAGDEYFIGAITAEKDTYSVALDFLPSGAWQAEIYEDSENDKGVELRVCDVSADARLTLPMMKGGGAAIYIARKLSEPSATVQDGYMCGKRENLTAESARLFGGSEPVCIGRQQSGILLYGGAEWRVTAAHEGLYTLRVAYSDREAWNARVSTEAGETCERMPASRSDWDLLCHDLTIRLNQGESAVRLARDGGETPAVAWVSLIDNHPAQTRLYPAREAVFTGGVEWLEAEEGVWDACSLGLDRDVLFDQIEVERDGLYILAIRYCGGDTREISIEINGASRIDTELHSTAGWGFPTWRNCEDKEVLVTLNRGVNTIRLFNDHGPMSHIRAVCVQAETL